VDDLAAFREATAARLGAEADGWLATLDGYLETLRARWDLELGEPYPPGAIGWTLRVTRGGAEPAVLKVTFPDAWFVEEMRALGAWDGDGAVRLLEWDQNGGALMERAEPGVSMLHRPDNDETLGRAADVLERLWIPDPGGLATVTEETLEWARTMPGRHTLMGRPFDRSMIDVAVALIRDLATSQTERYLLHGDLHAGNLVSAERAPWLAIDPKPLVGERAFDVTALIRDRQEDLVADRLDGVRTLRRRFDLLTERFSLDRERVKGWSIATMTDYALWCFEAGDRETGERQAEVARMLTELRT
jgi:streptomycin 6-kinase